MQSILNCGRLLSRALANGIYNASVQSSQANSCTPVAGLTTLEAVNAAHNVNKKFKFVTAVSGFSKSTAVDIMRPGKFGDDAYFITKHSRADVLGIADGVGGWRSWGIDPGQFSRALMNVCEHIVLRGSFNPKDPSEILASAYYEMLEQKTHILGSSTACLVILHSSLGRLFSANIGDSGFLVVRKGCVVHRSQEQVHYFNTPFQLSLPPPGASSQVLSDRPESAAKQEFDVQVGDMLVLATDGLFDNLPDAIILKELIKVNDTSDSILLQNAANAIARKARKLAFDDKYMSPFALNARLNGIEATGGKPDDITVILASVLG